MTFREAIVRDCLGFPLPLKWRRRVARWNAWCRSRERKIDKLVKGSHRRWQDWQFRLVLDDVFGG